MEHSPERKAAIEDHPRDDHRIGILLVEDHVSFRQALAFMLEREPGFDVVAQVGSVAETRALDGKLFDEVEVAIVNTAHPRRDVLIA